MRDIRTTGSAPDMLRFDRTIDEVAAELTPDYAEVGGGVVPGQKTGTFLIFGQSQLTNVIPLPYYNVQNSNNHMLNAYTGRCHQMKEPMIGASYTNACIIAQFADLLINNNKFARTVTLNCCVGGTTSTQWARGGDLNARLFACARRVLMLGQQPTLCIRHQGEQDYSFSLPYALMKANIISECETIRAAGVTSPIMICQVARVAAASEGTAQYLLVRQAQRDACAEIPGAFMGPDTDTLGSAYRGTLDIHFLNYAAPIVANMLYQSLVANLNP